MKHRSTIRLRLTLLYACTFFVSSAVLVIMMYLYVDQSLDRRLGAGAEAIARQILLGEGGFQERPIANRLITAITEQAQARRRETLRAMVVWSVVSLGAAGVIAVGTGWLLAGRVLKPLQQITATARRVADTNLGERIALSGPNDEIKDLADTFDAMLERLDRSFDGQRRFVANASHELRTPLTINRTLIEVALDDPEAPDSLRHLGTTLLTVNSRHERLIEGLLTLAGSHQLATKARVPVAELVRRAIGNLESDAERAQVVVTARLDEVYIEGDAVLWERLAHNVIDNAIRYNLAEGGRVWIDLFRVGDDMRLVVTNTGPVVADDIVPALFEPFRRAVAEDRVANSNRGAGLGLSIVRSVATAHGGTVHAVARPEGGLTVTVTLAAIQ
ncbi:sensor histidine kinase [Mycolicibacterium iranicum]|uniref:histidine kinase n=1 Tax=Mycolicibacterium iranicum TaxID=912594 RepID=A0ABT4HAE4_MYCIR|nr:HAMP domain-containing sensor histidine kinase [Mycolicibacterium iranicum]MCZ0726791.1 HAMP domain-containing sensor histidine kinase [Mycolicibacterium iranicum]